jgi:hypothetical protein
MAGGPKQPGEADALPEGERAGALPDAPRLPERAAIYIAPDGTVHFGALFEGLIPVAEAIGGGTAVARDVADRLAPKAASDEH